MMFLAACQSDALPGENSGGAQQMTARSDSSYINLRIVGNSQAMTRTDAAFQDDATAAENAVYDGILCIFEGESESEATLKSAVYIDPLLNNPGSETYSTIITITQHIPIGKQHDPNQHRYVLALLNTTSTGFKVSNNVLLFDGSPQTGMKINVIQNLKIHSVGSTDKHVGLFMSNAPQDNGSGGITIMPEATALFNTEAEAQAASSDRVTINVERAAARVKVTNAATTVSSINLDGDANRHPTVHRMTWALHNYNTQSYAIRNGYTAAQNWATSITGAGVPIAFDTTAPDIFDLYKQLSYIDGDVVYIAENTTTDKETEVIVEVQLKEGSFLLGDCYKYDFGGNLRFFTSTAQFIQFCKDGWASEFAQYHTGLTSKSAEEIFKYPSFVINNNGTVTLTLTNESFTDTEKTALSNLSGILSGTLRGYRNGKMYYTYKIKHSGTQYGVVRNNAYNLTLQNSSISGIGRPTP